MTPISTDLNCDLGEYPHLIDSGVDDALLSVITSANIACGGHAGDAQTMLRTVRAAGAAGVAIGAHPSYPDRANFGRKAMEMPVGAVEDSVFEQVQSLQQIANEAGFVLGHVKPHGALYHKAATSPEIAREIGRALLRVGPKLAMVCLADAPTQSVWSGMGIRVVGEGFADRRYEPTGGLRSRELPGALIDDPEQAGEQAVRIAKGQGVEASDGSTVIVRATTLCVHGDTPHAPEIARAVREALERAGVRVKAGE